MAKYLYIAKKPVWCVDKDIYVEPPKDMEKIKHEECFDFVYCTDEGKVNFMPVNKDKKAFAVRLDVFKEFFERVRYVNA